MIKELLLSHPLKYRTNVREGWRVTYMDNEQLTEAIINLLKKINRTEALELIYELAKRLQD